MRRRGDRHTGFGPVPTLQRRANETFGTRHPSWPERRSPPSAASGQQAEDGMSSWWKIALSLSIAAPAVVVRLSGAHLAAPVAIAVFGAAVVASAFLLVWAAEAARHDISGNLATAILAVIAVLPEYAVDLYFAWSAGHIPENAQYAAANMTGSNRLLLGLGWPFVALLFAWGALRRGERARSVQLHGGRRMELRY